MSESAAGGAHHGSPIPARLPLFGYTTETTPKTKGSRQRVPTSKLFNGTTLSLVMSMLFDAPCSTTMCCPRPPSTPPVLPPSPPSQKHPRQTPTTLQPSLSHTRTRPVTNPNHFSELQALVIPFPDDKTSSTDQCHAPASNSSTILNRSSEVPRFPPERVGKHARERKRHLDHSYIAPDFIGQ